MSFISIKKQVLSDRLVHLSKAVETPIADIIRMKDSKMVEFCEFYDTVQAFAASHRLVAN